MQRNVKSMPLVRIFLLFVFLNCVWGGSAVAEFEVEEPEVEKGKVEIEVHGDAHSGLPSLISSDGGIENEVVRHADEVEFGLGLTDFFSIALQVEFEKEREEDGSFTNFNFSEIGFESKIVIIPVPKKGFGTSLFLEYEQTIASGEEAKTFGVGPIVKYANGPFSATGNMIFNRAFDISETEIEIDDGDVEVEVNKTPDHWNFAYAWQVKYQVSKMVGVGAEGFGDILDISGDVSSPTGIDHPDTHRIGPMLYLNFGDDEAEKGEGEGEEGMEISTTLGVLFGLNNQTSDIAVKWDVEFEF